MLNRASGMGFLALGRTTRNFALFAEEECVKNVKDSGFLSRFGGLTRCAASTARDLKDWDFVRRVESSLSETPMPPPWQVASRLQELAALCTKHINGTLPLSHEGQLGERPRQSGSAFFTVEGNASELRNRRDQALIEALGEAAEAHASLLCLHFSELNKTQLQGVLEAAALILAVRKEAASAGTTQKPVSHQEGQKPLRTLIALALPRFEEQLHSVSLSEKCDFNVCASKVGRVCWYVLALSSQPSSDAFFLMAVDARVRKELSDMRKQGVNSETAQCMLRSLSESLHVFAHPLLKRQMEFLRSEDFVGLFQALLEAAENVPRDVLLRILHLCSNVPEAREVTADVLRCLDAAVEELPDALFADVCASLGVLSRGARVSERVLKALIDRRQKLEPHLLAHAVLFSASHLTKTEFVKLAKPLADAIPHLNWDSQIALLSLYTEAASAETAFLTDLIYKNLLSAAERLGSPCLSRLCAASGSRPAEDLKQLVQVVFLRWRGGSIEAKDFVECLAFLSSAGVSLRKELSELDIPSMVLELRRNSQAGDFLPQLAWTLTQQCVNDLAAWAALAAALPSAVSTAGVLELARLYEAFTAARILGLSSFQEEIDSQLESSLSKAASGWRQQQAWKAAAFREREREKITPPYEQVLKHLNVEFKTQVPTALYRIPFLFPKLSLIFNPIETPPVSRVSEDRLTSCAQLNDCKRLSRALTCAASDESMQTSGFHAPDVSVQHRVWGALGYNCLSLSHAEFSQFFLVGGGKLNLDWEAREDLKRPEGREPSAENKVSEESCDSPSSSYFDVPAAAAFLRKKLDQCKPTLSNMKKSQMKPSADMLKERAGFAPQELKR